jgi:1-acyl-sn-glycerol-3-phosphate acyltransferase
VAPSTGAVRQWVNRLLVGVALLVVLPTVAVSETVRRGSGLRVARRATLALGRLVGVRFEVRGLDRLDPAGSYVLVPNHHSPLDIPAMVVASPEVRFVAAAELFSNPVLRVAMDALGTVRVDRDNTRKAVGQLAEVVRDGGRLRLVVFAEGGLVTPEERVPFKSGAFVLAIDAQAAVVPVALHGTGAVLPKGGLFGVRPGRIVVELLEPIPTTGLTRADRKPLRNQAQAAVRSALDAGP